MLSALKRLADLASARDSANNPAPELSSAKRSGRANWPLVGLGLAVIVYIGAISFLHGLRQARLLNGFDLAFYRQAIWNTTQGRFLEVSATDFSSSLLGTDALLIYALLAPFYMLLPSTLTLVVVETVVVALGALPVYWLARDKLGSGWAGLGLGLVYLLLPAVQNGNLYELRERPMAGTFLLFAFYFWQKDRLGLFTLAAGLALACRPENGLVLAMLGLYGWLSGRSRPGAGGWRAIIWPVAFGLGWLGAALLIIRFAAGGNFALGSTFAGGSPVAAVLTLVLDPVRGWSQLFPTGAVLLGKLLYVPLLLAPLAFLPLLRPLPLLMALPPVGLNLLAGEKRALQWNPFDYHYQAQVIPWLLVATIFALAALQSRPPGRWAGPRLGLGLVGLVLCLTLTFNLATNLLRIKLDGVPNVANGWGPILRASAQDARWEGARALLQKVPEDAPLAITNLWAAQVAPRRGLWLLAERPLYSLHPAQAARFVFADVRYPDSEETSLVARLLAGGEWREAGRQAGYVLLERP